MVACRDVVSPRVLLVVFIIIIVVVVPGHIVVVDADTSTSTSASPTRLGALIALIATGAGASADEEALLQRVVCGRGLEGSKQNRVSLLHRK
jgi:hypothetical protein